MIENMNKVMNLPELNLKDMVCDVIYDQYKGKNVELFLQGICQVMDNNLGVILRTYQSDLLSLKSAKGIALDIWGSMLRLPRSIQINDPDSKIKLTDENFIKLENVNEDGTIKRGVFVDDAYRMLLQLRLQTQNTPAAIPEMSKMISNILNNTIAINDHLDMQFITFYVSDELPPYLDAMIADPDLDLLPRPAGTGVKVLTSIWRYHYLKYEGEFDKKLSSFYVPIFYDPILNEDNIPIYKTLVYYTNADEYIKQHKSWYNLTPYKAKLDKDDEEIQAELDEIAQAGKNQEDYHEATYNYLHVNQDSIDPGVWSDLYDDVSKEYWAKPNTDERKDMSEEWEIKKAHLDYLIQKKYNFYLQNIWRREVRKISPIDDYNYKVKYNKYEFAKDLFLNPKDNFFYTESDFNIDSITSFCMHNNYLFNHHGLTRNFNPSLGVALQLSFQDKPKSWVLYEDDDEQIYLASRVLERQEYEFIYIYSNPFYDHWQKVFNEKVKDLPNLDTVSEYEIVKDERINATEKEILFDLFYIAMLAYRFGNGQFARHFSDMKRCSPMMESLKRCEKRWTIPKWHKDLTEIEYASDGEPRQDIKFLLWRYQQNKLVYEKVASDFGSKNHSTTVANTYALLADNYKREVRLFQAFKDFFYKNCRELTRNSSFTAIGQDMTKFMQNSKDRLKERLEKIGNEDLTTWINEQIDTYMNKLLDKQNYYIRQFSEFDAKIKEAFDDEKYYRKMDDYGNKIYNCLYEIKWRTERLGRTKPKYQELQAKANYSYNIYTKFQNSFEQWTKAYDSYFMPEQSDFTQVGLSAPNYMIGDDGKSHVYGWFYSLAKDMGYGRKITRLNKRIMEAARAEVRRMFEHKWYEWQAEADKFIAEIRPDEAKVNRCKSEIAEMRKEIKEINEIRNKYLECNNLYLPDFLCYK